MPSFRCPRCGATHFSVGRSPSRAACPRCLEPMTRAGGRRRRSLRCRLSRRAEAAASARQALEAFRGHIDDETIANGALLATELVTNSVKHSGDSGRPIDLAITASPEQVRIEVTDGGPGFEPRPAPPHGERESGWGLLLVEELADSWGVERGNSFRVWAEIGRAPAAAVG